MLYDHWTDFKGDWCWINFTPEELSCRCCGEYYHDEFSLDLLQSARRKLGKPIHLSSAHRCVKHNKEVGGRTKSEHLRIAFDLPIPSGTSREEWLQLLFDAGFTTFGLYNTFIHTDRRSWRKWYGTKESTWSAIYDKVVKSE